MHILILSQRMHAVDVVSLAEEPIVEQLFSHLVLVANQQCKQQHLCFIIWNRLYKFISTFLQSSLSLSLSLIQEMLVNDCALNLTWQFKTNPRFLVGEPTHLDSTHQLKIGARLDLFQDLTTLFFRQQVMCRVILLAVGDMHAPMMASFSQG